MSEIDLDVNAIKALASEKRMDILKTLNGKKMSLKDISASTKIHEVTVQKL